MIINTETLEQWIDQEGAWGVLLAMELILSEKAEHMRANWQDKQSARVYDSAARKAGKLMREFEAQNI